MISARCTRQRPVKATRSGWRCAPGREGGRPFSGAADLVGVLAGQDHAAVDDPGDDRRELARGHRDHRLVEQAAGPRRDARPDQDVALLVGGEGEQVGVAEALSDRGGLARGGGRRLAVAAGLLLEYGRQQQVAALDAVALLALQQPPGAPQPAARPADLPVAGEGDADPERAAQGGDLAARRPGGRDARARAGRGTRPRGRSCTRRWRAARGRRARARIRVGPRERLVRVQPGLLRVGHTPLSELRCGIHRGAIIATRRPTQAKRSDAAPEPPTDRPRRLSSRSAPWSGCSPGSVTRRVRASCSGRWGARSEIRRSGCSSGCLRPAATWTSTGRPRTVADRVGWGCDSMTMAAAKRCEFGICPARISLCVPKHAERWVDAPGDRFDLSLPRGPRRSHNPGDQGGGARAPTGVSCRDPHRRSPTPRPGT